MFHSLKRQVTDSRLRILASHSVMFEWRCPHSKMILGCLITLSAAGGRDGPNIAMMWAHMGSPAHLSQVPPQPSPQQDLAVRQYAPILAYMATECSMFWSRSQLFLVANSALIGFAAKDITTLDKHSDLAKLSLYLVLSILGLLLCALWLVTINLGSKWMNWWISKLTQLEPDAYGTITLWSERPRMGRLKVRYVAYGTAGLFTSIWAALFAYLLILITHHY